MIYSGRQNDQIILLQLDAHPVVSCASHIEESLTVEDVSNLLVFMKVLVEERLHFVFVDIAHFLWRDCDLVSVLVAPFFGNGVDIVYCRAAVVNYTKITQIVSVDHFSRIVILALVTLKRGFSEGRLRIVAGLSRVDCRTNKPSLSK